MAADAGQDIRDRAFRFACSVSRVVPDLAVRPGLRPIADQLLKAGTSVGANLEEARAASSRREFIRYVEIALREARESTYWLRVCVSLNLEPQTEIERLRGESDQIARILATIVINTKARS